MSCPKCSGFMLYAIDEEAWRCVNCGQRAGFQPVFADEYLNGISRRGSLAFRERVSRGMRESWARRRGRPRLGEEPAW
jgi:hypothetical protein